MGERENWMCVVQTRALDETYHHFGFKTGRQLRWTRQTPEPDRLHAIFRRYRLKGNPINGLKWVMGGNPEHDRKVLLRNRAGVDHRDVSKKYLQSQCSALRRIV